MASPWSLVATGAFLVTLLWGAWTTAPLLDAKWTETRPALSEGDRRRLARAALPFFALAAMVPVLAVVAFRESEPGKRMLLTTCVGTILFSAFLVWAGIRVRNGNRLDFASGLLGICAFGGGVLGLLVLLIAKDVSPFVRMPLALGAFAVSGAILYGFGRGLWRKPELKPMPESSDLRD